MNLSIKQLNARFIALSVDKISAVDADLEGKKLLLI
jgi:hypothetical protein